MIKVLILEYPFLSNVAYWRIFRPLMVMKRLFPGVFDFRVKRKELNYADAFWADVVIMSRPCMGPPENYQAENLFLQKCRDLGVILIMDLDDHLLGLPDDHELYSEYNRPEKRKAIFDTLSMANALWVSTPAFLETYSQEAEVIPNAVLPADLPATPADDNKIWAWRGRAVQVHDLVAAGAAIYERIKEKPKMWYFLGYRPPLRHADNTRTVPYVSDPEKYIDTLKKSRFNVIWKPMVECSFNDHKSNIAWIEATMTGGICLTNYAGKPGWEFATSKYPGHEAACELWAKSVAHINEKYNLINTATQRANSILRFFPHIAKQ